MTERYHTRRIVPMPPSAFSYSEHPATIGRGRVVNHRLQHRSGSLTFTHSGSHPEAPHGLTLFGPLKRLTKIVHMN
jgi:hypothetical protein